ncbi:MAG: glycosyltransferase family 4 protein [Thermoanaerobaculales bacterium]|jgi:glycosyltransferase involved in cell wall biosynthesis|nr:glycosyltransferase family 4 protein [Thermoanaerobaculales bacterium]
MTITGVSRRLATAARNFARRARYRYALALGETAGGDVSYRFEHWNEPDSPLVELRLCSDEVSEDEARAWCRGQTLAELRAVGFTRSGHKTWRVDPPDGDFAETDAAWFAAPGKLPDAAAAHLETCLLIAAAERIDAVVLRERVEPAVGTTVTDIGSLHEGELRPWALFRSDAYAWNPAEDALRPTRRGRIGKLVDTAGVGDQPRTGAFFNRTRRGPYLFDADPGPDARVALRDAALMNRSPRTGDLPAVLVTAPFLARGGAEQTLLATMQAMTDRFRFSMATFAPHRAALGDRRDDFLKITDRIYCLGDVVHPDAMVGMVLSLLDAAGAEILYNANGTTLFYDFAPRLKAARPGLRILDHLYDHRIGYIEAYGPGTGDAVDICVAENRPIADVLVEEHGWPPARVPVIWPCGRPDEALPPAAERDAVRRDLRRELGFRDDDVVVITAARMHPQKRPLDLVALAERLRDLDTVHFLIAGGGDLEDDVDEAIARSGGARVRRLPFHDDIPRLILAADVGCLVSEHEGLPVFALECLQLGRPFLGTRVGDLGSMLDETGAGIVVDRPGDLDALEAAVRRLADPAHRTELAGLAAAAAPRFSVAACADAYARALLGEV